MCSATFGDQMWSTRGVGLNRVLAAIRVRSGNTVKLVVESPDQYKKKAVTTTKQRQAMEDAKKTAQAKKDQLLNELEKDEERLKSKKFFGLF
jgi:cell division septum initiation protein DivIVA